MKRGRPFEPGNQFGRGRPKGSRNKRSSIVKQMLDESSESIMRKAIAQALEGDVAMLRTLLGYMLPPPKELPCDTGPLPMGTVEELSQSFDATLKRVASGRITLSQAGEIFDRIEARRRLIETQELEGRMSALERNHPKAGALPLPPGRWNKKSKKANTWQT